MPESFDLDRLPTPIGTALLVTDADGLLRALDWEDHEPRMKQLLRLHYGAVELKNARAPRELRAALTGYFKGDLDFDGIAFSTTIHQQDKPAASQGSEAVEFFFPVEALRCYETFDCTGQQMIDQGSVLINGERVNLDLQMAEGSDR